MNAYQLAPIFSATEEGDSDEVKRLLGENPDLLHARLPEGDQPLHLASWQKHADLVRVLIDRGADINARGEGGKTPLHYAVYEGDQRSTEIVRLLLDAGVNANSQDDDLQQTPLGYAKREHMEELDDAIQLLANAGSIPDLESAVFDNNFELAQRILRDGPAMTIERIRTIRDVAAHHPGSQLPPEMSDLIPAHLTADRSRFVKLIDNWLKENEA